VFVLLFPPFALKFAREAQVDPTARCGSQTVQRKDRTHPNHRAHTIGWHRIACVCLYPCAESLCRCGEHWDGGCWAAVASVRRHVGGVAEAAGEGALTDACALLVFSFCAAAPPPSSLAMSAPAPAVPAAAAPATATATAPGNSAICQAAEAFVRQELAGNDAVSGPWRCAATTTTTALL
jgi:hypothetical protein